MFPQACDEATGDRPRLVLAMTSPSLGRHLAPSPLPRWLVPAKTEHREAKEIRTEIRAEPENRNYRRPFRIIDASWIILAMIPAG